MGSVCVAVGTFLPATSQKHTGDIHQNNETLCGSVSTAACVAEDKGLALHLKS